MRRAPGADWPRILNPAPGCLPPLAPWRQDERVLHVALYPELDLVPALQHAVATISSAYARVDYMRAGDSLPDELYREAQRIRPTLVFAQLHHATSLVSSEVVGKLRELCDPRCVMVQWNGDFRPDGSQTWFRDLGRFFDASLFPETQFQSMYAVTGVRHPGFFAAGVAETWADVMPPVSPGVPPVVLLASCWVIPGGYNSRTAAIAACQQWYGRGGFGLYGHNWFDTLCGHPYLSPAQELGAYRDAKAALSISVRNDVARCTSERLFRALYAGAVVVAERFPDCEGLGLEHGHNCLLWNGLEELHACLEQALGFDDAQGQVLRAAAKMLSHEHTWSMRVRELLAIVDAVRSSR